MNDIPAPSKVMLDAETDQALALFRDKRATLTGPGGGFALALADSVAEQILEQFGPGHGRLVMAVAQALGCVEKIVREDIGSVMPATALLTIAALAAEQLEHED